jgi:flagellar basal body-associated protein FliL
MKGKTATMWILLCILIVILLGKVASLAIDWHFQNERLKIEKTQQEERSRQNQAFLDYLKDMNATILEGLRH